VVVSGPGRLERRLGGVAGSKVTKLARLQNGLGTLVLIRQATSHKEVILMELRGRKTKKCIVSGMPSAISYC
jgi:hypothetical protein